MCISVTTKDAFFFSADSYLDPYNTEDFKHYPRHLHCDMRTRRRLHIHRLKCFELYFGLAKTSNGLNYSSHFSTKFKGKVARARIVLETLRLLPTFVPFLHPILWGCFKVLGPRQAATSLPYTRCSFSSRPTVLCKIHPRANENKTWKEGNLRHFAVRQKKTLTNNWEHRKPARKKVVVRQKAVFPGQR